MRCLVCLQVLAFSLVLQEVTSKPFSQSSANSHGEAFEWHARKVGDKRVAIVSIKKDPNRDRRSVFNDSSGRTSRHHHGHHRFSQAPEEHHRRGASGRGRGEGWRHGGKGEEPTRDLHRRTESPSSPPPYDHPDSGLHSHNYQSRHERRRTRHHEELEDEDRSRISLRQSHRKDHVNSDSRPASFRHHNGRDRNRSPLTLISTRSPDVRGNVFEDEDEEDEDEDEQDERLDVEEEEEDLAALDLKQETKRHRSHLTHTSHTTEDLVRRYGRDQVSFRNETRPSRAAKKRMKKKNGRGQSKKGEKRNKKRRDKKKRREKKRKRNKKKKGRRIKSKGRQGRRKKKDPPPPTSEFGIDVSGATDTELTGSDACQYKNMLTCGQNTSILEHTDNISDVDSQLVRKCIARQEFFTCMEKEREKPCNANQKARGDMSRLRGRIRDAIWTSGNCIVNQMVKVETSFDRHSRGEEV